MSSTHAQFVGSIPEIYDAHLGPVLFDFSGADLAERVAAGLSPGARVLEIACGTGLSTAHLRRALPAATTIMATDLQDAMIDFAKAKHGGLAGVSFGTADGTDLPFEDNSFDAVVCQFGVMFYPDKARGYSEMARVLKPGGLAAFNVWDSFANNPVVALVHNTIGGFFETDPPRFLETPFGYYQIDPIRDDLQGAGFRHIDIHIVSETVVRPDPHHVARGFVEGNPSILEIRERADPVALIAGVAMALEDTFGPAPVQLPLQEITFLATKSG